jgi:hypothetical protein
MDPPGHTVFLYLQQANRKELQKQAKEHGIKANQTSEILRRELQAILTTKVSLGPEMTTEDKENEDTSITTAPPEAKPFLASKIPSVPVRKALGSRNSKSTKTQTSKLRKPQSLTPKVGLSNIVRDYSNITKTKDEVDVIKQKTAMVKADMQLKPITNTGRPRPKPMPMSKRNELQYEKFLKRQEKGKQMREDKMKRNAFAHLVR